MNYKELMAITSLEGWRLATAYYLALKHGLMGHFPAIWEDTGKEVLCLDLKLLENVGKLLPARNFRIQDNLVLANEKKGIAVSVEKISELRVLGNFRGAHSEPIHMRLLTQRWFDQLMARNENPFKWRPGLVGNDMNEQEFLEALALAANQGPP